MYWTNCIINYLYNSTLSLFISKIVLFLSYILQLTKPLNHQSITSTDISHQLTRQPRNRQVKFTYEEWILLRRIGIWGKQQQTERYTNPLLQSAGCLLASIRSVYTVQSILRILLLTIGMVQETSFYNCCVLFTLAGFS